MIRKLSIPLLLIFLIFILIRLNLGLLRDPLPEINGRETLAELAAPVEVLRTPAGIPTLHANSTADVFRALGYVHAQDRLWQMELLRRVALGKLAEIFGPDYLETDQFLLKWQFGQQLLDSLSVSSRFLIQTYCEGLNAFIKTHPRQLPFEFSELKFKPREWHPQHCLAIWRLFGWLNSRLDREIFLWNLQHSLPKAHLLLFQLTPGAQPAAPAIKQILRDFSDRYFQQLEIIENLTGLRLHSESPEDSVNALVYAPRGRLTIPNLFYLQHLKTPEFNVWGCAIPGIPLLPAGTNGKVAWSLEPQHGFDTRLNFERKLSNQLLEKHVFIPIAGADTLVYSFLNRPGQFLLGVARDSLTENTELISLDWSGFQNSDEFAAWTTLFGMSDADSLPDSFRHFSAPFSSLKLMESSGRSGAFSLGAQWEREHWQLFRGIRKIPPNFENTEDVNRQKALLRRILENLEIPTDPPDAALLLHYLKNWDMRADSASVAATLFNLMSNYILQNIFLDEMGERCFREFLRFPDLVINALDQVTRTPNSCWIDNVLTVGHQETLSELIQLSFTQTLDWLAQRNKRYLPACCWGSLTAFRLQPVLTQGNARDGWLTSEGIDWRDNGFPANLLLQPEFIPEKFYSNPLVLQFELADSVKIHWRLSTGQSGHPYSRNYRNQTKHWLARKQHTETLTTQNTNAFHRLILEPSIQDN